MDTKTGEYKGVRYSLFPKHGDTPSQRRLGQAGKWNGVHYVYAYETTVEVGRGAGTESLALAAVHRYIDYNNPVRKTYEEGVIVGAVTPAVVRTFVHHDVKEPEVTGAKIKGAGYGALGVLIITILVLWYFLLGGIRRR